MMVKRDSIPVTVVGEREYSGRNLGPLVLVNPLLERMDIRRIVNLHCPQDPRLEVSVGDVIYALVANRLCSAEPLVHVAGWAGYSGAEFVLGTAADALNDDRLARALDRVFPLRWNILADVALQVCERFGVSLSKLHYDPTSFHFTGQYDEESPSPSLLPELKPFRIEVGRHARPGHHIKEAQVGVNLANDGKGPLPVFYHSADGSDNGHRAVAKNLQHLLKYLKPKRLLLVTDRGCFCAKHAVAMVRRHHFDFISSVTWKDEYGQLYETKKPQMQEASFLSLNERRKRETGKSEETWERYLIGEIPYTITHEKESIRARMIFVHSSADAKACRKTRARYTEKIKKGLAEIQRKVDNGYLKEIRIVHRGVNSLYGSKQAQKYFTYRVEPLTPEEITSLPPRRPGQRKRTLRFSFQYHPEIAEKDATHDGLYALLTSLARRQCSTDEVFTTFKEQHHIETAHHQWKAPIRLRPVFLKKATRIESLVFVQFLALMAFYLLQRLYRLAEGASCRTTGETLLRQFAFCAIGVRYEDQTIVVSTFPVNHAQAQTLSTLGFPSLEEQIRRYLTRRKRPRQEPQDKNI
jgi:transposase